jgi:WD40 repeat protein
VFPGIPFLALLVALLCAAARAIIAAESAPDVVWTTVGHPGIDIAGIAVAPDGSFISSFEAYRVSGLRAGLITWSQHDDSFLFRIPINGNSVAISPDAKKIAAATAGSTVEIFDAKSGALLNAKNLGVSNINNVAYSPDGQFLAGAGRNLLWIWRSDNHQLQRAWTAGTNINSIVFLGGNSSILAAVRDGTIYRIDIFTGSVSPIVTNQTRSVGDLAFSAEGAYFSAVNQQDLRIYRTADFSEAQQIPGDFRRHAISPDGKTVALAAADRVELRRISDGALLKTIPTSVGALAFSSDGKRLYHSTINRLFAWKVDDWSSVEITENSSVVQSVAFSRDGGTVALGARDGLVQLRDVRDKTLIRTIGDNGLRLDAVRFSPTTNLLAVGRGDSGIYLYNSETGVQIRKLTGHSSVVSSLSFSTSGDTIASGSWDSTVRIWSVEGAGVRTINGHTDWVNDVSLSGDGQIVASASQDNSVRLFDTASGSQLFSWTNSYISPPLSVAISRQKKYLAVCDSGGALRIWNIQSRTLEKTVLDAGFTAAFSPTGEYLATMGAWNCKLFNSANFQLVASYNTEIGWIQPGALSPNSDLFIYASQDGFVQLAKLPAILPPELRLSFVPGQCSVLEWSSGASIESTPKLDQRWTPFAEAGMAPLAICSLASEQYFRARWIIP